MRSSRGNTPVTGEEITEEVVLKHILYWGHVPQGIAFEDKTLQVILEAFEPEVGYEALPTKLPVGSKANELANKIAIELRDRPILNFDETGIVPAFNWLKMNEHVKLIKNSAIPFKERLGMLTDFKLLAEKVEEEETLFEQLQDFRTKKEDGSIHKDVFDLHIQDFEEHAAFSKGNMMIIAARPGNGKTLLSLYFGLMNALEGKKVMFVSLEMSKNQILERVNKFLLDKQISEEDQAKMPFIIKYGAPREFSAFKTYIKDVVDSHHPDILIVDYIQLFNDSQSRNKYDVVGLASKFFKGFAMAQDLGLITCSQVARTSETFGINLGSLFGSSELEADADIVIAIERGSIGSELLQPADLKILKNRDGKPVEANVLINYETMNIIASNGLLLYND